MTTDTLLHVTYHDETGRAVAGPYNGAVGLEIDQDGYLYGVYPGGARQRLAVLAASRRLTPCHLESSQLAATIRIGSGA